jgi:hypothetical protein
LRQCFAPIRLLAHRFVSFQIMPSLLVGGGSTSRDSYFFLSEKWLVEGLTAKVFGGDFDLVRTNLKIVNPYFQTPRGHANVGFHPRKLAATKRCRFESRSLSEPAGKCNLAGAGCKSWLGSASWLW